MNFRVTSLDFSYQEQEVLKHIELVATSGEVIGLVGPNGSGKTTLLKCLAGLLETRQSIAYDGRLLETIPIRERAALFAYVAQNETNEFPYEVIEIVRMGLAYKHSSFATALGPKDEVQINSILEEFDLSAMSARSIQFLSGGEWQRVMLARAFAQKAQVLLLDEPTNALDLRHLGALMGSIHRRSAEGGTTLLSLHDLNLAAATCDRVLLLDEGAVVQSGKPEDVLTQANIETVYQANVQVGKSSSGELQIHLNSQNWRAT